MSEEIKLADANLRALADLNKRCQELEAKLATAEQERDAMRRTASALADEKGHIATDLFEAQQNILSLRSWHDVAARSIDRLGALVEDLRVGAEQQSQSHADVLAKIKGFRGNADFGVALLSELGAARELIAHLRTEYVPECACDVCRAIAEYDKARGE